MNTRTLWPPLAGAVEVVVGCVGVLLVGGAPVEEPVGVGDDVADAVGLWVLHVVLLCSVSR
jgi:hypothetical protein